MKEAARSDPWKRLQKISEKYSGRLEMLLGGPKEFWVAQLEYDGPKAVSDSSDSTALAQP